MANWRGWVREGAAGRRSVTSARLDPSAKPRNRLFPKTRSWFALDAPLELLSPLSVLRVLFAVAIVTWPLIALTTRFGPGAYGVIGFSASTVVLWLLLFRADKLDPRVSQVLVGYWTVAVGTLVWCAHETLAAGIYGSCLIPIAVFTALFLGQRAVVVVTVGSAAVLAAALFPTQGTGWASSPMRAAPVHSGCSDDSSWLIPSGNTATTPLAARMS